MEQVERDKAVPITEIEARSCNGHELGAASPVRARNVAKTSDEARVGASQLGALEPK